MGITLVVGAQWGDEGKGKVVDFLSREVRAVVRAQGGNNAGHTVNNEMGEFKLHAVPSGIFHEGVDCIMGPGTVINPDSVQEELEDLEARGVPTERLFFSDRAHIVMPYHLLQEEIEETLLGRRQIGTTRRGIGPAYADKHGRYGLRLGDLLEPEWLRERLELVCAIKNPTLQAHARTPLDREELLELGEKWRKSIGHRIVDTSSIIAEYLAGDQRVLIEGQLGAMRDVDHGIYPFVTSSAPCAAGLCQGAGIAPTAVDRVVGIVKAYSTAVGAGPMVTELHDQMGERIREVGQEYGASTGRPRRCGWLDLVALRTSARLNGYTGIVITRLDILDTFAELRVCKAYSFEGEELLEAPTTTIQERSSPLYESFEGWMSDTSSCRTLQELPKAARVYIDCISEEMNAPVDMISVGPAREQTIVVR